MGETENVAEHSMSLQNLILNLLHYWAGQGCYLAPSYDVEVGAGTMTPDTFFRVLDKRPWNVAYVQPSRRPTDGRYGENPNRVQKHHQFQVIMKPSPADIQSRYIESLAALGIRLEDHDLRFDEDDWESPTIGAWGVGWQVLLDGLEITQFTYFQQAGGIETFPIPVEITYGLERLEMFLEGKESIYDLQWSDDVLYRDLRFEEERQFSEYNFNQATVKSLREGFALAEAEAAHLIDKRLPLPAYDQCLKCSHTFNLLDARGAISVTERVKMIAQIRTLVSRVAALFTGAGTEGRP
jgi:glycyl-tRNA synthetase alpha chain